MKVHVVFNLARVIGVFVEKGNAEAAYKKAQEEEWKIEDPDSRSMPDMECVEISDYTEPSQDWP